jgi:hypothetical protein
MRVPQPMTLEDGHEYAEYALLLCLNMQDNNLAAAPQYGVGILN